MNDHDSTSPMSIVSKLDAVMEALQSQCPFCSVVAEVIPASGTRYVIGITHERGCPEWVEE